MHRLVDARCPIETLNQHPVDTLLAQHHFNNTAIPLPPHIFSERKNAYGVNIDIHSETYPLKSKLINGLKRHGKQDQLSMDNTFTEA